MNISRISRTRSLTFSFLIRGSLNAMSKDGSNSALDAIKSSCDQRHPIRPTERMCHRQRSHLSQMCSVQSSNDPASDQESSVAVESDDDEEEEDDDNEWSGQDD